MTDVSSPHIEFVQGHRPLITNATVLIVIDVIRAFTTVHWMFLQGASRIILAQSKEEAFDLRHKDPLLLLAGEEQGLPIIGFDLGNSPAEIARSNLAGKKIALCTTNGTVAALYASRLGETLVTGLSNALPSAEYAARLVRKVVNTKVVLLASHPSAEEDIACGEYLSALIAGKVADKVGVLKRIRGSINAKKFYSPEQISFNPEDMEYCSHIRNDGFVMRVCRKGDRAVIERIQV